MEKIPAVDKATTRSAALKSIDSKLDLGNGMTVVAYDAQIKKVSDKATLYNTTLSTVDNLYNEVLKEINVLNDFSERMLSGVGTAYGKDSNQYEMAGGVRKSEKKKPTKKATK